MKICLFRGDEQIPFDLVLTSYLFYLYICTADANVIHHILVMKSVV